MKITIQSAVDKTVYTMENIRDFKDHMERCLNKGTTIKITQDAKTYLINPANIVWVEISEEQGA